MDQRLNVHSEQDLDFIGVNELLNDAFAKGGVEDPIAGFESLVSGVFALRLSRGVELLEPLDLDGHRLFDGFFARCSGAASDGATNGLGAARLAHAPLGFIIVFTFTGSANHSGGGASHHGHDGVAQIHFASGAVANDFFSDGESKR